MIMNEMDQKVMTAENQSNEWGGMKGTYFGWLENNLVYFPWCHPKRRNFHLQNLQERIDDYFDQHFSAVVCITAGADCNLLSDRIDHGGK